MLRSPSDAEDAVQEAWLRASRADTGQVENPAGWLTTIVARVCLNTLEARRARREEPAGALPPEPAAPHPSTHPTGPHDPENEALLADSVGVALMVVLDTLTPPNGSRSSCTTLAVHDLDEALRFYRDVLGFTVRHDIEFEGTRWVSVSPPAQPDVQIVLEPPGVHRGATPADRRLAFATDDCDATFAHIEAAGADVMQEPISRPFGARDCAFCDPSGNVLRFTQPRGG